MDKIDLILGNEQRTKLVLGLEKLFQDFPTGLNREWARNVLARRIKGETTITANGATSGWVVADINKPVPEGD